MEMYGWPCEQMEEKVLRNKFGNFELTAELVDRDEDSFIVEFTWQPENLSFAEVLDKAGVMPIPPYLKRGSEEVDYHVIKRYMPSGKVRWQRLHRVCILRRGF